MTDLENLQSLTSPGGFIIGHQGWVWGEPRPRSITFFLDNTASVHDQYGRPIKGTVVNNKKVLFATSAPSVEEKPGERSELATHSQIITALAAERIDWKTLTCAGWPQLPYEDLEKMVENNTLPPTPLEELRKIKDPNLRKAAMKARKKYNEIRAAELSTIDNE